MKEKCMGKTDKRIKPIDAYIGNRVRVRRTLLGLSQDSLAQKIDITFQQIQKYEKGTNRIAAGRLYEISQILEVPIEYFFTGYDSHGDGTVKIENETLPHTKNKSSYDVLESKETIELVRVYYTVKNTDARKDIVEFIKCMAARIN